MGQGEGECGGCNQHRKSRQWYLLGVARLGPLDKRMTFFCELFFNHI